MTADPSIEAALPAATGIDGVDRVLARVADLRQRPPAEHVAVFEQAHEALRQALDVRPDVTSGGPPGPDPSV